MMDVFGVIEGGCVVAAAAGIAAALLSCKCDGSRGLLRDALDVVAQLGDSPGEGEQLLRLAVDGRCRVCRTGAVGRSFGGVRWHRWFGG